MNVPVYPGRNDEDRPVVVLDLYSRLQSVASSDHAAQGGTPKQKVSLAPYAMFFNAGRIYERVLRRKRQKGWQNLVIVRGTVARLLQSDAWYELYLPRDRRPAMAFDQVRDLEDIAVDLIAEYADVFYRRQRRRWEHGEIEVVTLTAADPNNAATYELSVDATEAQLVKDARDLADAIGEGRGPDLKYWYRELKIGTIQANAHAYRPLLYAEKERVIAVQPVPLDEHERRVVEGLEVLARNRDPCLHGKEAVFDPQSDAGPGRVVF